MALGSTVMREVHVYISPLEGQYYLPTSLCCIVFVTPTVLILDTF